MTNKMDFLKGMIQDLKDKNLFTELPVLGSEQKNRVVTERKRSYYNVYE